MSKDSNTKDTLGFRGPSHVSTRRFKSPPVASRRARMRVAIMLAVAIFVRADLQQAAKTAKLEIVGGSRDDVAYRFEESLEGWALASSSEMHLDVAARGGNLVGTIVGEATSDPHFDSPLLELQSAGRQTVVIRMKYQSGSLRDARLVAQYGAHWVGSQQQHRSNVNLCVEINPSTPSSRPSYWDDIASMM